MANVLTIEDFMQYTVCNHMDVYKLRVQWEGVCNAWRLGHALCVYCWVIGTGQYYLIYVFIVILLLTKGELGGSDQLRGRAQIRI